MDFYEGDIVGFSDIGVSLLDVPRQLKMVVISESTEHKDCYVCSLVNAAESEIIKNNCHFSSFDPSDCTMSIHHNFIRLIERGKNSVDFDALDELLSTV